MRTHRPLSTSSNSRSGRRLSEEAAVLVGLAAEAAHVVRPEPRLYERQVLARDVEKPHGHGHHVPRIRPPLQTGPAGLQEKLAGRGGIESLCKPPGKDTTGEIVDHGMQIDPHASDQPDHRDVNVPVLVGPRRTHADLRLDWI